MTESFTGKTKLREIAEAYPDILEKLKEEDDRFKMADSPFGRLLLNTVTVDDVAKRTGYTSQELLDKLEHFVAAHRTKDNT